MTNSACSAFEITARCPRRGKGGQMPLPTRATTPWSAWAAVHTKGSPEHGVSSKQAPAAPLPSPCITVLKDIRRTSGVPGVGQGGSPVAQLECVSADRQNAWPCCMPPPQLERSTGSTVSPGLHMSEATHLISHHPSGSGVWVLENGEAFFWECGIQRQRRKGVV